MSLLKKLMPCLDMDPPLVASSAYHGFPLVESWWMPQTLYCVNQVVAAAPLSLMSGSVFPAPFHQSSQFPAKNCRQSCMASAAASVTMVDSIPTSMCGDPDTQP
jgi:hypothetical protein